MAKFGAKQFGAETQVVYNNSGAALAKGDLVSWGSTVSNIENPTMDPGSTATTIPVLGVKKNSTDFEENFLGVAAEAIPNTTWGYIVINGYCDAYIGSAQAITAGDLLMPSAIGFVEQPTISSASLIAAVGLAACDTSSGGSALCKVQIAGAKGMGNVSTVAGSYV